MGTSRVMRFIYERDQIGGVEQEVIKVIRAPLWSHDADALNSPGEVGPLLDR
jgi:hypothetical protein